MKRLLKNNFFKIGFLLSGVFILLAILGYLITPDKTQNANHIMPEWANFSPGSKVLYLDVTEKCGTSFWDDFTGREVAVERFSIVPGSFRSVGKKVKFKHLKTRTDVEYESSYFSTSIPQEKTFFFGYRWFWKRYSEPINYWSENLIKYWFPRYDFIANYRGNDWFISGLLWRMD